MHEVEFVPTNEEGNPEEFDFANENHRNWLTKCKEFTFGHYSVGEGTITMAGAIVDGRLYYGLSMCSPQDNFSKKSGRNYAEENLIDDHNSRRRGVYSHYGIEDEKPAETLRFALESHLEKMRRKPHWVKKGVEVLFRGEQRSKKLINKDIEITKGGYC